MPPTDDENAGLLTTRSKSTPGLTSKWKRPSFLALSSAKDYGSFAEAQDAYPAKQRHRSRVHPDLQGTHVGHSGVRDWYQSFSPIDWQYESLKEHARLRHIRRIKGWRGRWLNSLDRAQGWILAVLTAIVTALIAYAIVISEAFLFDIKDGFCRTDFWLPKRFCCPHAKKLDEPCPAFVTWASLLTKDGDDDIGLHWFIYLLVALLLATMSAALTVYLTRLEDHTSRKTLPRSESISAPVTPKMPRSRSRQPTADSQISFDSIKSSFGSSIKAPQPRTMYMAAGAGIPEVKTILSGVTIRGYLGIRVLFVKAIGLTLSVASGLSLGKEGPLVHIASCVANVLSRFFSKFDQNEAKRREMLSAACAAGVAVAFGAPVGGILFSLEEVSRSFPNKVIVRAFFCALVAAMTLQSLDPYKNGKIVLFEVTYDRETVSFELLGFLLLGVLGGVYGAVFCKCNIWWCAAVRQGTRIKQHPILEIVAITLLTGLVSFNSPWLKMGGPELVAELFTECRNGRSGASRLCLADASQVGPLVVALALAIVVKFGLTVITFGARLPAGIFIPTLAVVSCIADNFGVFDNLQGALTGRILGLAVEVAYAANPDSSIFASCRLLHDADKLPFGQACVIPGVWAMIGAGAALAGVTRMCVSLAVILFELTNSLDYVLPIMLSILIAKAIADALEPRSIYDATIELSELPFLDASAEYLHTGVELSDILDSDPATISLSQDNTLGSLRMLLAQSEQQASTSGFPILVRSHGEWRIRAYISITELASGLEHTRDRDADTPVTFASSKDEVQELAQRTGGSYDFGWLSDSAPLCVAINSPLELVHSLFTSLGVLYVVCTDSRGVFLGTIDRTRYLSYLQWSDEQTE